LAVQHCGKVPDARHVDLFVVNLKALSIFVEELIKPIPGL
jgi:hypothetical protein